MEEIYIKIPGKPLAKKTHRTNVKVDVDWIAGKYKVHRWPYFPMTEEVKETKKAIIDQYKGPLLDSGIFVRFIFHMKVPKSWSKRQTNLALDGRIFHISKPDASNLAKYYEDCMKGLVYTDDSRIVWVSPIKKYDYEDYTEIFISEFNPEDYARFQGLVAA